MSMLPPPPESKPYFIAILDLLGFKAKLCDDSGVPRPRGLEELYETYFKLLWAKDWSTRIDQFELGQEENLRYVSGRINSVVASDTILFWANDDEAIEAEKKQEWIGVAVLSKAVEKLQKHPGVVEYCVPVKPDTSNLNHALLWHWAEYSPNAPEVRLKRLMNMASEKDKLKYENALAFVAEFASD